MDLSSGVVPFTFRVATPFEISSLSSVVTVADVVHYWGYSRSAVWAAATRGALIARQDVRGFWLLSLDSVRDLWGEPMR